MKDDRFLIENLASNKCFIHSNNFQNGVNTLSKKLIIFFVEKINIFYSSNHMILFKFHQHAVQILTK